MKFLTIPWLQRSALGRSCALIVAVLLVVLANAVAAHYTTSDTFLLANLLVTPANVMKEIGRRLVNNLKFANNVLRSYDGQYVKSGAKQGWTVNARLPQRYKVNKGQALNPQPVVDQVVPITLTDQANVGIEFSMASLTMEIDNYREKAIAPAVDTLVNAVDFDGLSRMYLEVANCVGTPGTLPASTLANPIYLSAGTKLDDASVPMDNRIAILSSGMHAALANANLAVFNPQTYISQAFRKGQFAAEALGISKWYKDQNVASHTTGALGGTPLIDGATQTGSSILLKGWTSAVATRLNRGDVIQFAGCYAINPMNYQSTGALKDFVVTADGVSTSGGAMTVTISPALITVAQGALATCTVSPADSAAVTIYGHASTYANKVSPQGLVYHEEAFALVMADLEMPGGVWVSERISNEALGVAIRFVKDYSIMTDQSPARVDTLYGWKAVRPELATRVAG